MVTIKLKDGSQRQYPKGTTLLQVAEDISKKLAQNAVVARFNGQISDLNTEITEDGTLELLDFTDPEAMAVYRHSSSHVMAQAVQRLWPGTQLAIGPAIDKGFYYVLDVFLPRKYPTALRLI
jgi:threonyl-tRNA synthetase